MSTEHTNWKEQLGRRTSTVWTGLQLSFARFRAWIRKPTTTVAIIGLVGLALDLFWKPLTTGALVMLGLIALPGLLKIVKRAKIAGVELEAQSPDEVEQRI